MNGTHVHSLPKRKSIRPNLFQHSTFIGPLIGPIFFACTKKNPPDRKKIEKRIAEEQKKGNSENQIGKVEESSQKNGNDEE